MREYYTTDTCLIATFYVVLADSEAQYTQNKLYGYFKFQILSSVICGKKGFLTAQEMPEIRRYTHAVRSLSTPLSTGAQSPTTQLRFHNSTTELPYNNRIVPRGTTVLLECRVTPHQQQIHYNWTCPHPPCDGEYRKVYNNLILIIANTTTGGQYKCTPTPHGKEVSVALIVQTSLPQGKCNIIIQTSFSIHY